MATRRQAVPRSVWILLPLLLIVAAFLIWSSRSGDSVGRHVRGGPLVPFTVEEIDALLLTHQGGQFRFEKSATGYWSLSGAVSDYLAQNRMRRLVEALVSARGGMVIPGSEVEDRRYDFNALGAMRLTLLAAGGRQERLAIGAVNPVTGLYYASGAGRGASFTVTQELRDRLARLPASVQLDVLLPLADRQQVTALDMAYRDRGYRLQRRDDRWWIRPTADESPPPLLAEYLSRYDDRRLSDGQGTWYAADFVRVDGLIFDVSAPVVRQIPDVRETGALRRETGLDRPAWRVVLNGTAIDPDPRSDDPDRLELSLAFAGAGGVPMLRRGNVLVGDVSALRTIDLGSGHLFDTRALPFRLAAADSLHLDGPEGPVIWAAPGADGWRSYPPPSHAFSDTTRRTGREAAELVTDLDRTQILAVLPPSLDRRVLADDQRLRLTAWFTAPGTGQVDSTVVEFGFLTADVLPAGANVVDFDADNLPPVGIWSPATGRLLQMPGYVVITGRNFRDNYRLLN